MKIKMTYYKKSSYIILLILLSNCFKSQTITVTGTNWTVSVPTITEAGSNYVGPYESATNQAILAVNIPIIGGAKISVNYEANPTWNSSLVLSAKRTNNGSTLCVSCTISGGTSYQALTLTAVELFRIQAVVALTSYTGINIQFQLSGVSVTIPAATYQSRVVFTVGSL